MSNSERKRLIRIGHSPDPDDAFMFYAIQHKKIDLGGFTVEHVIRDIQSLNQMALQDELEVTAASLHAFAYLADRYYILPSGVSMGDDYGPVLVSHRKLSFSDMKDVLIASPGELTTAELVARIIFPEARFVRMPFDQIAPAVIQGKVEAGILIHEGQLTYSADGLQKVLDFGEWWKREMYLPLPLGVDLVRRDLGEEEILFIQKMIKESIEYGMNHRKGAVTYSLEYARGLARPLADRFIHMYVNDYTLDFGMVGRLAVKRLLEEGARRGLIPPVEEPIFSDEAILALKQA